MSDLVGQLLNNRYHITNLLGEGGMGGVYKAHDQTLKRDVAIKVMKGSLAGKSDFRKRFLQEAQTAAHLDHSGIVRAFDFGEVDDMNFIVMEFIMGDNLQDMMRTLRAQQQWIKLPEAIELVREIAVALDYAHRNGVLHRDIKPANIMIRADGGDGKAYQPVVTDLGLAKLDIGAMQTQIGSTMGTPPYMSPEQALGEETDQRSDIYSLGILFYELAVGQLPFQVSSISQAIKFHVRTPPPPPSNNRPDIPSAVEDIIMRAIVKAPEGRYQSMGAFAQALQGLSLEGMPQTVPPGAIGGASSLMTKYQESVLSLKSQVTVVPTTHQGHTRIRLRGQDGTEKVIPFRTNRMVIGRQSGVEIVLRDEKVSRRHAIIDYDGSHYWITDLGSTNGVYIGKLRLRPNSKSRWDVSKPLQVGKHRMMLEPGRLGIGPATGLPADEDEQRGIDLALASGQLSVMPGRNATLKLRLTNKGRRAETVAITAERVPRNWIASSLPVVQLGPGARQEVAITINPPVGLKTRGGSYPILLRAATQTVPRQVAVAETQLSVQQVAKFSSELLTKEQKMDAPVQLTINNQGTALGDYQIDWSEPSGRLSFSPEKNFLKVPPGKMSGFKCTVDEKKRLIGRAKQYTITAQIKDKSGQRESVEAELVSKATIPAWASVVPLALLVVVGGLFWQLLGGGGEGAGGSGVRFPSVGGGSNVREIAYTILPFLATSTPTPTFTPDAPTTSTQEALVAEETAAAEAAIVAEATGTAAWLAGDDDSDGISNDREIALNLQPNKADSDGDGLTDGEELENKTDPLDRDSDGDGIIDGQEVQRGLNPLSSDSDGDSTPDASDNAPLATPTPTTDFTATAVSANATADMMARQTQESQSATAAAEATARQQAQEASDATARAISAQGTATAAAQLTQQADDARRQANAAATQAQKEILTRTAANRATAASLSATETVLARPRPPTNTSTPVPPAPSGGSQPQQSSDNGPVTNGLISKIRGSGVNNNYPSEAERLAGFLVARLSDFPDGGAEMRGLLGQRDAGDRVNAIVHKVWKDWKAFNHNHMTENPANHNQTPFRQLVIRLVQGRQGSLSSQDRAAIRSWFTRNENWGDDTNGVIGAINREIYGQ